jgi:hypothetical protein
MSTVIETRPEPFLRSVRRRAAVLLLLSGLSLALGQWVGPYALFLAVPVLLFALRYWTVLRKRTPSARLRMVPAIVHGVGMLAVFAVVPGVQYVRDSARRLDSA